MSSLVEMERDFVTAAFFRHAVAQRSAHMQQLEQMHDIMDSARASAAAASGSCIRSMDLTHTCVDCLCPPDIFHRRRQTESMMEHICNGRQHSTRCRQAT